MESPRKVVLITGGNTGIGLEVVRALAASASPYDIVIGCRTVSKGEDAIATVKQELPSTVSSFSTVQADLNSDTSLEAAVESLAARFGRLDVLINNGGAQFDKALSDGTMSIRAAFNASWDTNVTGTHVLTTLAIPLLLKSADPRLLFLTSGMASLVETERLDNPLYQRINGSPDKGWPKTSNGVGMAYRSAKTGLNMMMREWSRLLLNDGVKVWSISPGFLATGLTGTGAESMKKMGAKDPSEGGRFIRDVVEGKRDQDSGKAIRVDMIQPW
ncbi:NAD(P)-binding protein [Thozetella sp. PMI_491]|nr:NAD(P)-binding protein [Thozetella sp. PMI_491]